MASKDEIVKAIARSLDAIDANWTLSENQGGAGHHCLTYQPKGVKSFQVWFTGGCGDVKIHLTQWMGLWDARDLSLAVERFISNKNAAYHAAQLKDMEETFKQWLD